MSTEAGFAFLLPFIFICFGCLLLALGFSGSKSAIRWGLGYLAAAGGFLTPWVLSDLPAPFQATIADALFIAAAYCNSQALFVHFGLERLLLIRRIFALAVFAGTLFAVHIRNSLALELLIGDAGFVILMASPLPFVLRTARSLSDYAVIGMTAAVALNTVVRNIFLVALAHPGEIDQFASSQYAYFMQASDGVLGMLLALSAIASIVLRLIAGYRDAADRDPLTQVLNRRGFERMLKQNSGAQAPKGAIIACDIDHFKAVNDRYGHAAGDRVLAACAKILQIIVPRGGMVARFGGEEFVVYVPQIGAREAKALAETMRQAVADYDWRALGISSGITASFGIGELASTDASIHDAISRADGGLYEAKAAGRNRVADGRLTASAHPALRMITRH